MHAPLNPSPTLCFAHNFQFLYSLNKPTPIMVFMETIFEIESTEDHDDTSIIERSIDYGENEESRKLTKAEIDELKGEIERISKIINKKQTTKQ